MVVAAPIEENRLLPGLTPRPPELGRIRLGEKTDSGAPKRLNTFRLTSYSEQTLKAAAVLYGGTVKRWTDGPDEGLWQLTTAVSELDILIPGTAGAVSQAYEFWQGGTCERRCDGVTEQISGSPCLCSAAGESGADRTCDVLTRIKVMLPRVPGLGVWRLDTSGWQAATTLPSTLGLLAQVSGGAWIPAVLRAEQRSKRARLPNGKVETHRFVVPVLDLPGTTIGQLVEGSGLIEPPRLESGERPAPLTARERAALARARLEEAEATADAANVTEGVFREEPSQAATGAGAPDTAGGKAEVAGPLPVASADTEDDVDFTAAGEPERAMAPDLDEVLAVRALEYDDPSPASDEQKEALNRILKPLGALPVRVVLKSIWDVDVSGVTAAIAKAVIDEAASDPMGDGGLRTRWAVLANRLKKGPTS